jgi:hypothetical protein
MKENVYLAVPALDYQDLDRRHRTLRYQYGIASQTIHTQRGELALARERIRDLESQLYPVKQRVFNLGDPEPEDRSTIRLQSSKPYANWGVNNGKKFELRFTKAQAWEQGPHWWSFIDGNAETYSSSFDYWLETYGPFTEILND